MVCINESIKLITSITMQRKQVSSSRVNSVGWENNVLEVEFNTGVVYQYSPIPEETAMKIIDSPNVGKDIQAIVGNKDLKCVKL